MVSPPQEEFYLKLTSIKHVDLPSEDLRGDKKLDDCYKLQKVRVQTTKNIRCVPYPVMPNKGRMLKERWPFNIEGF